MTFSQILSILRARWVGALMVFSTVVLTTVITSLLLPKRYTATASVVLDVRSPDPIAGMVLGAMAMPAYMATQVDIIQSDRVARRVAQGLRLTEDPATRESWIAATEGRGDFEAWVADLLKRAVDVKPSRESNVISISYTSPDPRLAASMANTFVKAYTDISIGLRSSPAKQYNDFFDARAKELRDALEQAQGKLSAYQREHGIVATDERFDVESQRLNELTSQLVAIQAIAAESNSRSAQANNSGDQLPDVINNAVVAGLRADLSRQEARLQELSAKFGDEHPQVKELRANISELVRRIATESRRVGGSVTVNSAVNKQREFQIRSEVEQQRGRVLKLKEQRDQAAVLQREVETAQRNYDQVVMRMNQSNLESQNTQTNISVLTPATEPGAPSGPKVLLNTLVSIFLGLLLGGGFAMVRELLDRRVRSLQDLGESIGVTVLGVLPPPIKGTRGMGGGQLLLPTNVMNRLPRSKP